MSKQEKIANHFSSGLRISPKSSNCNLFSNRINCMRSRVMTFSFQFILCTSLTLCLFPFYFVIVCFFFRGMELLASVSFSLSTRKSKKIVACIWKMILWKNINSDFSTAKLIELMFMAEIQTTVIKPALDRFKAGQLKKSKRSIVVDWANVIWHIGQRRCLIFHRHSKRQTGFALVTKTHHHRSYLLCPLKCPCIQRTLFYVGFNRNDFSFVFFV